MGVQKLISPPPPCVLTPVNSVVDGGGGGGGGGGSSQTGLKSDTTSAFLTLEVSGHEIYKGTLCMRIRDYKSPVGTQLALRWSPSISSHMVATFVGKPTESIGPERGDQILQQTVRLLREFCNEFLSLKINNYDDISDKWSQVVLSSSFEMPEKMILSVGGGLFNRTAQVCAGNSQAIMFSVIRQPEKPSAPS